MLAAHSNMYHTQVSGHLHTKIMGLNPTEAQMFCLH
jgi:hypothetical protein